MSKKNNTLLLLFGGAILAIGAYFYLNRREGGGTEAGTIGLGGGGLGGAGGGLEGSSGGLGGGTEAGTIGLGGGGGGSSGGGGFRLATEGTEEDYRAPSNYNTPLAKYGSTASTFMELSESRGGAPAGSKIITSASADNGKTYFHAPGEPGFLTSRIVFTPKGSVYTQFSQRGFADTGDKFTSSSDKRKAEAQVKGELKEYGERKTITAVDKVTGKMVIIGKAAAAGMTAEEKARYGV